MIVTIVVIGVVVGLALVVAGLLFRRLYTERQVRLAEKAHLEQELRRTERRLHRLTSQAFDAMLAEARRAGSCRRWM